jgi:hypothetical protein
MTDRRFSTIKTKWAEAGFFRQLRLDDEDNSSLMLALVLCADEQTLSEARELLSRHDRETALMLVAEERNLSLAPEDIGLPMDLDATNGVLATDGGVPHGE